MDRKQIADILEDCATLLELKGENPFRCNAYRNAARAVQQLEGDLHELIESGGLKKVKGIGETMAQKIVELERTGTLEFYVRLRNEIPAGLIDMLRISGFGPKRIQQAYKELGIDSIAKLKVAAQDGSLAQLKGFGKKLVEKIVAGIDFLDRTGKRVLFPLAYQLALRLREALEGHPSVRRLEICGSVRRRRETIKDIDILVASSDPEPIMKQFVELPEVIKVVGHGPTKSSVLLLDGIQADLRVVSEKQFPFALHYFTGSKAHNVAMRARAQEFGLKLNEYELAGPKRSVDCPEEADIFAALGLDYIPPELREDTGEIDAAAEHRLPNLLSYDGLAGCFHCHTNASDGGNTLEEMANAAKELGLTYLGIADHSQTAAYAGGLTPDRVLEQFKKIDALNERLSGIRLFKGIESDILADGSLDYDDELLAQFDYVVASVHMPLNMTSEAMTARVIRAVENPYCTMLGHPTGRLLLRRDPFPIDMEAVLKACARTNTMIEINASPYRLDIDWLTCKRAKAMGVQVVINPDAHSTAGFDDLQFGIATARRGWLEAADVFNTRPLEEVIEELQRRRQAKPVG